MKPADIVWLSAYGSCFANVAEDVRRSMDGPVRDMDKHENEYCDKVARRHANDAKRAFESHELEAAQAMRRGQGFGG